MTELAAGHTTTNASPMPPTRALYTVPEAIALLSLSRSQIYELIRAGRIRTVTEGRRRLVPASAIVAYVDLLISEAEGTVSNDEAA